MHAHPGIVFHPGPAGRRAGLAGGADAWEVVRVFQGTGAWGEETPRLTADLTGLSPELVRTSLGYCAEYRGEVDAWIERVEDEALRAEAAWRRERALLGQ